MRFLKIQNLVVAILFITFSAQAQHKISVQNIDLIAYNDIGFMLYEKISNDSFKKVMILSKK